MHNYSIASYLEKHCFVCFEKQGARMCDPNPNPREDFWIIKLETLAPKGLNQELNNV